MLMAVCHSTERGWNKVEDLSTLSDLREEAGNLLWAESDVKNLSEDDIKTVAEEFNLHFLAVEDAVHLRQRPKLEAYPDHAFVVIDQLDEVDGQLEATQIACFVGPRYMVTIHAGADKTIEAAKRRWTEESVGEGPAFLLHTLLDVVVDDYERISGRLEDQVEELEDILLEQPDARVQRQLYSIKQYIARMRRYALPVNRFLSEIVNKEVEEDLGGDFLPGEALPLYRDLRDHLIRLSDQVGNIDDLTDAMLDLVRSEQAMSLNQVTKKLTAWAAIIAVPTYIASVYGMNFELVPEDGKVFGFWFAVSLMAGASLFLYLYFKRKDWL